MAQLGAVAVIMAGVSGCSLLDLLLGINSPFDPDTPFPTSTASVTTGTARIELQGETLVLDELSGGSIDTEFGSRVTWTNGEGWYLTVVDYSDPAFPGETAYLSLDRIVDSQHWVVYDSTRCVTTIDDAPAGGVKGSAICRGLEWSDYFSQFSLTGQPEEIEGEPAFDADITFEAK